MKQHRLSGRQTQQRLEIAIYLHNQGWSYREIAAILSTPITHQRVHQWVQEGRSALDSKPIKQQTHDKHSRSV